MRIAILSVSYAPEPTGIGPYSAELAESLVQRGHEVRVVTTFPYYPAWRPEVPRGTLIWKRESRGGVQVTRCRMYVPRTPRPMRRVLQELSWLVTAAPAAWRHARWADVCIVVSPAFAGAVLGAPLARLSRTPMHLHVQDVVPDIAVESGQLRSAAARRAAVRLARWTYGSYRSISVLGEGMRRRLSAYVSAGTQVSIIPNWVRWGRSDADVPKSPRVPFEKYAVYAGSLGEKQGLGSLSQASALLTGYGGVGIVVLGDGPGRARLPTGAMLVSLGVVSEAEYNAVLAHAVAGIVTLQPGVGDSIVPSKLLGYMGAGLPVIVLADATSEAAQLVREIGCGKALAAGRGDLLAQAVVELAADPAAQRETGARGEVFAATEFARERCVDVCEQVLLGLVTARASGLSRQETTGTQET